MLEREYSLKYQEGHRRVKSIRVRTESQVLAGDGGLDPGHEAVGPRHQRHDKFNPRGVRQTQLGCVGLKPITGTASDCLVSG